MIVFLIKIPLEHSTNQEQVLTAFNDSRLRAFSTNTEITVRIKTRVNKIPQRHLFIRVSSERSMLKG